MENLNKLYELTLKIKSIIHASGFKENDVHKAYFENLYSIINGKNYELLFLIIFSYYFNI